MYRAEIGNRNVSIDVSALSCGASMETVQLEGYLGFEERLDWNKILKR